MRYGTPRFSDREIEVLYVQQQERVREFERGQTRNAYSLDARTLELPRQQLLTVLKGRTS